MTRLSRLGYRNHKFLEDSSGGKTDSSPLLQRRFRAFLSYQFLKLKGFVRFDLDWFFVGFVLNNRLDFVLGGS
ncbi:hypothetical protein MKW98_022160 [Papaver atlanticum]|uniref:Uncharacterized protein n=1 Tax=Papaver atlanticum TaxID=357466 RepID=A0AAD4T160_9MAGN|nr:hypothetical protein MKW98_022160 [Papaver atlanticum]